MEGPSSVTTFLFTDIQGSTRLWEEEPERMRLALARHDTLVRSAVESNRGAVVKMSPADFGKYMQEEAARWQMVIDKAGIKGE